MGIKIFKAEIEAGLESVVSTASSIAYSSLATGYSPNADEEERAKLLTLRVEDDAIASSNPDQFDLYYLNSVLVSVGWNKNDDVFDKSEVWTARNSPEDKQFNFMHDESDIIGHITGNKVVDFTGKEIVNSDESMPDQFDIVTSAVLYNSWSDENRRERMQRIIAEIEEGKWFVSMECLFRGFDYAVISPGGNHKVIARDEESAFLTKHLRTYGGTGEYEGYKLGRLLRNISFSGKGLVSNPANPKSVILNHDNPFYGSVAHSITDSDIRENFAMANEDSLLHKQIEDLKAELSQVREDAKSLHEEMESKKTEEIQAKVDSYESQIAEKDGVIAELADTIKGLEESATVVAENLVKKEEEFVEALSKIEAFEAEIKSLARKNALVEAGVNEEDAEEMLTKFADASDEMFGEIVSLLSRSDSGETDEEGEAALTEETTEENTEEVSETEADSDDDVAEVEAETETFDEVEEETEATLADAGDVDSIDETRAGASEWLSQNVLHTTSNLNEK